MTLNYLCKQATDAETLCLRSNLVEFNEVVVRKGQIELLVALVYLKHRGKFKVLVQHACDGPLLSFVLRLLLGVAILPVLDQFLLDSPLEHGHVRLEFLFKSGRERHAPSQLVPCQAEGGAILGLLRQFGNLFGVVEAQRALLFTQESVQLSDVCRVRAWKFFHLVYRIRWHLAT